MKSKINTLILLAVAFLTFSVGNSGAVPQQYSTALLKDGAGPMLLSGGGGPMCIPGTPCTEHTAATILLAGGPGPMCLPDSGCGSANMVQRADMESRTQVLLAGGPGPMCPPDSGCAYDVSTKNSAV